jgi:hypothetical protein
VTASINQRIERIQHAFDGFALNPKHQFDREAVPEGILAQLAATGGFPQDYLSLLRSVGTVAQWGLNDCAMIDWCVPCSISEAVTDGKCFYDIRESNFARGEVLLYFAWDCRARVYFFDTTQKPWSVVSADGLSLSFINEEIDKKGTVENTGPFECDDDSCALEIIEHWVEFGVKCGRPILPES